MTPEIQAAAKHMFAQCVPNYETECIEWTGLWRTHNGYGRMKVRGRKILTHRVAYLARVGSIPDGKQVRHSCDNRLCVNPRHLSLGSGQDNTNDRKARDRLGFKLNTAKVREILSLVRTGRNHSEVARMFRVRQSTVSRIANGQRWAHIHTGGADLLQRNAIESVT